MERSIGAFLRPVAVMAVDGPVTKAVILTAVGLGLGVGVVRGPEVLGEVLDSADKFVDSKINGPRVPDFEKQFGVKIPVAPVTSSENEVRLVRWQIMNDKVANP